MLPENIQGGVIPERESPPDIFESLPAHAANALFLPLVSTQIIRNGITRIDNAVFDPENAPYFRDYCTNAAALHDRL